MIMSVSVHHCFKLTLLVSVVIGNRLAAAENIVFSDEFDSLNFTKWKHDITLAGGGNWEFQWYTNNRSNSFVRDGKLYIKPTLTSDHLGEEALYSKTLDLYNGAPLDSCTNPAFYGCIRTGNPQNILNPVKSASLRTLNSFSFKYGRLVIRAKLPAGDWLWPAIWLMPKYHEYGSWPASGEIDIMESRGNRQLTKNGVNIGVQQIASTLHWGPDEQHNRYEKTHRAKNNAKGYHDEFHTYEMIWSEESIKTYVDKEEVAVFERPSGGMWDYGGFNGSNLANPWIKGTKFAPFDKEFYVILNLAVGGVAFFPDDAENPKKKPWRNNSPTAAKDFWNGKDDWLPTWKLETDDAALQVDYIRIYQ